MRKLNIKFDEYVLERDFRTIREVEQNEHNRIFHHITRSEYTHMNEIIQKKNGYIEYEFARRIYEIISNRDEAKQLAAIQSLECVVMNDKI